MVNPPYAPGDVTLPAPFAASNFEATGTAGTGYYGCKAQTVAPATPASGGRMYANSAGAMVWLDSSGGSSQIGGTAWVIPSTATSGLQIYNTVDQTTNYERLELFFSSNTALIRTSQSGTGNTRSLQLSSGGATTGLNMQNDGTLSMYGTATAAANSTRFGISGIGSTALSGTNVGFSLALTYNQASGTATNTDFLINRTQTAVGSGAQLLIDLQVATISQFKVSNTGNVTLGGTALFTKPGGTIPLITTNTAITTGAGVGVGTLTNAPASTNPTKWCPIDDNGTIRYFPTW